MATANIASLLKLITIVGSFEKTIIDGDGHKITIDVPRDRAGEFTPQLVPKGMRRFSGFDDKVISLYARGMTMSEIH